MYIRSTRSRKPPVGTPIDDGNVLAQGLAAFWMLNEGTGVPVDAVSGRAADSSGVSWITGTTGPALGFTNTITQAFTYSNTAWINITGPITFIASTYPGSAGSSYPLILGGYQNGGSYPGYGLALDATQLSYWNGSSWNSFGGVAGHRVFAISQTGTSANEIFAYFDGQLAGTATGSYPTSYSGARSIGSIEGGGSYWYQEPLDWLAIWDRGLSSEEVASFSGDPWQVAAPRKRYFPIVSVTPSSGSYSASGYTSGGQAIVRIIETPPSAYIRSVAPPEPHTKTVEILVASEAPVSSDTVTPSDNGAGGSFSPPSASFGGNSLSHYFSYALPSWAQPTITTSSSHGAILPDVPLKFGKI